MYTVGFLPIGQRVVFLHLQVRKHVLTAVCAYSPNDRSEYPVLCGVLMDPSSGDAIVLLEDFNSHTDNSRATWSGMTGRNCLPTSGVLLVDACANNSLSKTDTMFEHMAGGRGTRTP